MFNPISFIQKSARVLSVSRRPTEKELKQTAKICSIGILIIGLVGVAMSLLLSLF